jgi:hypothetical protein
MFRALVIVASVTAALAVASPAGAEPSVPGMKDDAVAGESCDNTTQFVFGTDATGAVFACGAPSNPGHWVKISAVLGTRTIGTPCFSDVISVNPTGSGWTAAQSPEGAPLFCSYPTDKWAVHPTS